MSAWVNHRRSLRAPQSGAHPKGFHDSGRGVDTPMFDSVQTARG